jgi:DNA polymerase-3 subunit gamma/tau
MAGNSIDVLEIDGASNNGVEQVRELRETVKFAPARSKFKIYIIDEVHMLSNAAFNALLKTLEEPPPHVKFIFATTEPEKVLATIVSRCQRFDLRRISVAKIVERLRLIADEEGIDVDADALLAIARGADGGMRDAQSAFDQLISFTGKKIVEADVLAVFGLVSRETLENLARSVLEGDVQGVIGIVDDLDNAGKDLQRVVIELMTHFRDLLVCLNVDDPAKSIDLTDDQVEKLVEMSKLTNTGRLLRVVDILTATESRMRYALSRRTLLETSLIRCARAASVVTLDEILAKLNAIRSGEPLDTVEKAQARSAAPAPFIARRAEPAVEPAPSPASRDARSPASDRGNYQTAEGGVGSRVAENAAVGDQAEKQLRSTWKEFVERVSKRVPATRPAWKDSCLLGIDGAHIRIGFDPEFSEEMENLKAPRAQAAIKYVLKDMLKQDFEPVFEAVDNLDVCSFTDEGSAAGDEASAQGGAVDGPGRNRDEWHQDPHVQKVLEALNGSIVGIK